MVTDASPKILQDPLDLMAAGTAAHVSHRNSKSRVPMWTQKAGPKTTTHSEPGAMNKQDITVTPSPPAVQKSHIDAEAQWHRDTETQRHRDAETHFEISSAISFTLVYTELGITDAAAAMSSSLSPGGKKKPVQNLLVVWQCDKANKSQHVVFSSAGQIAYIACIHIYVHADLYIYIYTYGYISSHMHSSK